MEEVERPILRRPVAFATGALVIAVALFTFWPSGGGASPAAARALRQMAEAASSQSELPAPSSEQYLYSRTQERETSTYVAEDRDTNFLFITSIEVESWVSPDGSGRVLTEPTGIGFPTSEDEAKWEAAGSPNLEETGTDETYSSGELTIDLSDVPTEPDALLEAIENREILGGDAVDLVTFQIIGELLHVSYRSPDHRAALYEAAANFAGVDFEGSVTDPTGRPGVSVSFDGEGQRHELIFDPDTASLLAERRTVLDPKKAGVEVPTDAAPETIVTSAGPPETVVFWRLFMETAVVDSTDARP
jgi:hypothetical protein